MLPDPFPVARAVGPSVVVVYEPESVEDLCLLWKLRWCFGLPYGAPLGLPVLMLNTQSAWANEAAIFSINLSGSYFALTSTSVSEQDLASVADQLSFGEWRPEPAEKLMTEA